MAKEPVSPIMIWAGEVFHQRKPMSEPTIAAAIVARSRGYDTS